jgi:hypothetical protein
LSRPESEQNGRVQRWRKLGPIFTPPSHLAWARTHAQLPFAEPRPGGLHRVRFSSRDEQGRAQIGAFEVDLENPKAILNVTPEPEIGLGPLGSFDDRGATASWIIEHGGTLYQYYTGWNLGVTVPFYLSIGLALSHDDGKSWQKVGGAPVLGRSAADPFLTASPAILIEGGVWRMWYVSCARWVIENGKPLHHYHIRYAESKDGIVWTPTGRVAIDFESSREYAISRPCVVKDGGTYKLWYAHRASKQGDTYRIGYAESPDGLTWTRRDHEAGLDVSSEGWDSEMNEYPHVIDHKGRRYMLYNGNGYSQTGIGLAVLE